MKILNENYCSFKTCSLLKELGFRSLSGNAYYHLNSGYKLGHAFCYSESLDENDINSTNVVAAFTQTQIQKWLREKHEIFVTVELDIDQYKSIIKYYAAVYSLQVDKEGLRLLDGFTLFDNYEAALEEGIQCVLTDILLKNK